jgi:hypothetical protein
MGWGGAWLIPQRITYIEANASRAGESLVMPRLEQSGTTPVGLGKTLPGAQRNQSIEHRRTVSRPAGELVYLGSRKSPAPEVTTYLGREGGPAGAGKAQSIFGASAWRETRKPQGIVSPGRC